jgi:two-component system cell cycle sensor histidine kinase/response regulator CckA
MAGTGNSPSRILLVEDNPDDADLAVRELRRSGFTFECVRVETEADYRAELARNPDLILADYSLPTFSGLRALEILKAESLEIPLIIVTGTVGEESAVAAMKLGAADYLLKDRIARLAPAVAHALEQKQLRKTLQEREAHLKFQARLLESIGEALIATDESGAITYWNQAAERTYGWKSDEVMGKNILEVTPSERSKELAEEIKDALRAGQSWTGVFPVRHRDGRQFYAEVTDTSILGEDGKLLAIIGISSDITERIEAKKELVRREEKFAALIENASDMITVVDAQGMIDFVSPSVERILGYRPDELIGTNALHLVHPEDVSAAADGIARAVESSAPVSVELRFRHRDGTYRYLQAIGKNVPRVKNGFIVINSRDITESRKLQQQLLQAQKMEAIGQLSGGIAHDFNNLLTVILGHVTMLESEQLSEDALDSVLSIKTAGERAANLTRQLLLFARREAMRLRPIDLNETVENTIRMLRRIVGEDISLEFVRSREALPIEGDPGMLDVVLMNLAVNARDAMPRGGSIVIQTGVKQITSDAGPWAEQWRAILSVSDTGHGIPPEAMPHVFEPFFTTKEVGKGTGLGLATVFGIVQQHEGSIRVESDPTGTTFRISLPMIGASHMQSNPSSASQVPGGSETILLVEDAPAISRLTEKYLKRLGYRVLAAANGPEALELWKQNAPTIQLLLTDVIMPGGISGTELAARLTSERPGLPVIFASGYTNLPEPAAILLEESVNFLAKPYDLSALGSLIRARLDAAT